MLVKDAFRREIDRDIKEVIKVDDGTSILSEVEEYVPTDHISQELVETLEIFQDTINNPSEEINIWVSGFFGSGKSSFSKVLGYLLANPEVEGKTVADRFFELNEVPQAKALLSTIHASAPTQTVLLDLNTSPHVLAEGEPMVLPVYRSLLDDFGYSRDVVLAELEYALEGEGSLDAFSSKYAEVYDVAWESQRHLAIAKNRASRVLHELDPDTFPSQDSWSNAAEPPGITAKWFVARALELLRRRYPEKERLLLVVDEVGQYVSRSTDRMRHLQGLAEECQKTKGKLWLLATSQERLTDVVDSLEGKQTELAKAQDRFPIRVDLLPSDIDEVTGKRVLDKTADGAAEIRAQLDAHRNQLATSVAVQSDRYQPFADDDFVRLYPLVPYQLQVLIDAVSARRAQGGAPQTMGGSNRTLIRHAQQLLSNPEVGLADEGIGALVTLDRSYVLLEDVIPTAWRHEVDQVKEKHGDDSLPARIMRVVALCADVPGLSLTSHNLAVVLHPSIGADSIEAEVRDALEILVAEDRVREADDGYELQSPEQKDWEKIRRGIEMKPGDAVRLRKQILRDELGAMTVKDGRTFKVELHAEREKMSDGDIVLDVRDEADLDGLKVTSRSEDAKSRVYWAYSTADDTWEALSELHRSHEMADRYDNASQTDAQRVLLAEERKRRDRNRKKAEQLLARDIAGGSTIFDGTVDDAPKGDLRPAADRLIEGLLPKIYPDLGTFAGSLKRADVLQILQADSLDGVPEAVGPEGLGLYKVTAAGRELVIDSGPIDVLVSHIEARKQFGEDQNGAQLERHFGAPPFGAPIESIQAALAAAMRAGLIEVVSQAARITSANDQRLEQVFGTIPKFKAASFRPAEESGPSIEVRGEVSEWLSTQTGESHSLDLQELASVGRAAFDDLRQPCIEARSRLQGAGLAVPESLTTMGELLDRVASDDDEVVVTTLHERRADLGAGKSAVVELAELVEAELDQLKTARQAVGAAITLDSDEGNAWSEQLGELLARAAYRDDLAEIKSVTTAIETATTAAEDELSVSITQKAENAVKQLRSTYPSVGDDDFGRTVQPIVQLSTATGLEMLRSNLDAVEGKTQHAADALAALSTTKKVRHIRVSEVWAAAIASEEDLDAALGRLRDAVLAELDEDSEVRLR